MSTPLANRNRLPIEIGWYCSPPASSRSPSPYFPPFVSPAFSSALILARSAAPKPPRQRQQQRQQPQLALSLEYRIPILTAADSVITAGARSAHSHSHREFPVIHERAEGRPFASAMNILYGWNDECAGRVTNA